MNWHDETQHCLRRVDTTDFHIYLGCYGVFNFRYFHAFKNKDNGNFHWLENGEPRKEMQEPRRTGRPAAVLHPNFGEILL